MTAPYRALIVEDVAAWRFNLRRVARLAGASEIEECATLDEVRPTLRAMRFDLALVDIGLDEDDDTNTDGGRAVEMIREFDGDSTRCVLVTGWPGGDRLDFHSKLAARHGVDWAFTKENFSGEVVVPRLAEMLQGASARRTAASTPMENLAGATDRMAFESDLLGSFAPRPNGGINAVYRLASDLVQPVTPLVAREPLRPLRSADGSTAGVYWSRALGTAVLVELTSSNGGLPARDGGGGANLVRRFALPDLPELHSQATHRNLHGRIWELPSVPREAFPD